jgi:hypothetical protein
MDGGSSLTVRDCVAGIISAGIYILNASKSILSGVILDQPSAGRLLYASAVRNLSINSMCVFNGSATGVNQTEFVSCIKVDINGCRFKGGNANVIRLTACRGTVIDSNFFEVYTSKSCIYVSGANKLPAITKNTFEVIGGYSITEAIIDVAGDALNMGGTIQSNSFSVGSLSTVNACIRIGGTIESVAPVSSIRNWIVDNNCFITSNNAVITNGVLIQGAGNGIGHRVTNNFVDAAGASSSIGTGFSISSNNIGCDISNNLSAGGTISVALLSDSSIKPVSKAAGLWKSGSFTPVVFGGTSAGVGTYGTQSGSFVQVGDMVFISLYVDWSAHTGTGDLRISGLPFNFSTTIFQPLNIMANNLTFNGQLAAYGNSTSIIRLAQFATGGALTFVQIDTAASLYITGWYQMA